MTEPKRQGTQVITRACQLLHCFDSHSDSLSLAELARKTNLHPATAHRILQALVNEGLIHQSHETSKYSLGYAMIKYGELAKQTNTLYRVAKPHVEALGEEWGDSTAVDVMNHYYQVSSIMLIPSRYRLGTTANYYQPVPPNCIAAGKVLLAYLPKEGLEHYLAGEILSKTYKTITDPSSLAKELATVRKIGYGTSFEEQELGLVAVAAPIFDVSKQAIAAVSVGGPSVRINQNSLPRLIASVVSTAQKISRDLGYEEDL